MSEERTAATPTLPPPAYPPGSPRRARLDPRGEAPTSEPEWLAAASTEDVHAFADILERLAEDLRERGAAALEVGPGKQGLDAVLRGVAAGYLAGRREGGRD